ncbi:50S ribosomal protein L21e [Candidatus Micrarchaeota archaeon]|nr:50S ribosomal protein L21e [Candidatus Micrarchaeota archaeon]
MRRSHGKYSGKGRNLKSKGRLPITIHIREYRAGEKVRIDINPRFSKGMPYLRFNKKVGEVVGMQGNSVIVAVKDINKPKTLIVYGAHLEKI